MKRKIKTTEDPAKIEILKQGRQTEFWNIIKEVMEESKEDIQKKQDGEDIAELSPEQYKFRNELFKAKKEMIDNLIKTPENIISWLEKPETERQNFDPYDK
jgi:hypothetical protein